ncbi:hypothetical protein WJX72_006325 [[Myrmecia] bisecta]|uniref:PUM-HD domain-containing protein n=1 Tax=[Myrmecia] bisecta TaxID=41462 RepID=A0AAW1PWF4_9CHLO
MGAGTAQAAHADGLANGQDTLPPDGPGITRTGSAPPLVPSASTSSVDSSNSLGFNLFASPTSEQRTGKERAVLASEDYLRFYYAHKNINPRLPPPIASRDSWRAKWLPRQGSADGFQEAAGVLSRSADSPFSGQGLPEGLSVALSLPVEPVAPFRPKQVQAHHLSADGWYGHDSSSHPGTPHSRASHHEDLQLANGHLSALSVGSTSSPRYTGAVGDPPSILQHQRSGGSLRQLQSGLSRTSSMDPAIPMPHSPALSAPRVKVERGPSKLASPQRRQPPMHGSEVQPSQPQLQPAQHPQQVPSVTPASPGQVPALNMFPLGMYIPPQVLPGQQAMPQHPGAMYPPGYIMPWMMPSFHPGMMPMFGAPPTSPFAATLQQTGATNSPPVAIPIPSFTPEQAAYYQRFMEAHQAATLAHQMGNPAAAAAAFAAVAASPFGGDAAAAATAATAATLASQQPGQASSNSNNNHMTNNNNNRAEDGEGDSRDGGAHRRMRSTASAVSISSLTTSSSHPASCREQGDHDRGRPQHDTRADRDHQRGGKRSDRFRNAGSRWDDRSSGSPPVSVLQNSVLEDFKSRKSRRYELKDIAGNAFDFCRDQHGSRFLQQKLETAKSEEITALFKELQPRLLALMTDVFGNYVVQKILEYGDASHHQMMADQLRSHVMTLALQMYGCRVIQKSLEVLSLKQQCEVARELEGHVMRCVRDQNGNHVIQKCIERIKPTDRISFIIQSVQTNMVALACHPYGCRGSVQTNMVALACHPYGCRVVQRVLEHCTDEAAKQSVLADSAKATLQLAQDQYGNYVIQHILEHGPASYRSEIIGKLQGRIVELSQHKFASNVVEKCLQHGSPAKRQLVVTELLGPEGDAGPLQAMMKDQFANYVVQKMLEVCDDAQRATALAQVQQHLAALKKLTYGKHIMARLEKLLAAGHAMQKDNAECLAPAALRGQSITAGEGGRQWRSANKYRSLPAGKQGLSSQSQLQVDAPAA